ncbi:MAG: hypothetical protein DRG78_19600 [Epsilonproteobacteria bacterium]|nr:MAG: hypothetical protein DRG78_19600 [Campylobacterota bacterium]
MFKIFISLYLFSVLFLYAEQSMFGAGDLESSTPYGLTSAEKVIVKNKNILKNNENKLKKNEKKINKADSKLNNHDERIYALESILEGESLKLNKVYINLNKYKNEFLSFNEKTLYQFTKYDEYNQQNNIQLKQLNDNIENLQFQIEQSRINISTLKSSFDKMVTLMNEINDSYITKKEFNKLISILDKREKVQQTQAKKKKSTKSNKVLLEEARKLFKKDNFSKALPIFIKLIEIKHRPAECNYYVGEIKYYRKKYKDALHYFKNSMILYDKAKYLPKLLLHSAISFEKVGDDDNAQNFYNTIVDVYPDSIEAKEASKKIKNQI